MWIGVCAVVAIMMFYLGATLTEEKKNLPAAGFCFVLGAVLGLLALSGDPKGTMFSFLYDERNFADDGSPNYWAALYTGERFHKSDERVAACRNRSEVVEDTLPGGRKISVRVCRGVQGGILFEETEPIRLINDATIRHEGQGRGFPYMATRDKVTTLDNTKRTCWHVYMPDFMGRVSPGAMTPEFQLKKNGRWSEWFQRPDTIPPGQNIVHYGSELRFRGPSKIVPIPIAYHTQPYDAVRNGTIRPGWFLICTGPGL